MNELTIPIPVFRGLLRHVHRPVRLPVAWNRWGEHRELLARQIPMRSPHFVACWVGEELPRATDVPPDALGYLAIGRGRRIGQAAGAIRDNDAWMPLDRLKLVGPGMHVLSIAPGSSDDGDQTLVAALFPERWSRTIGALGEAPWRRLANLEYAIIGAGRSGSLLARSIADGWGAENLTLIDPDMLAPHNLGESDLPAVEAADFGRAKVDVLSERLRKSRGEDASFKVTPVAESILHLRALRALQTCDVVIVCVDHDGARLAASALAALFLKPLVDIAAGIHDARGERRMGADVRLVLPGRCLLCFGGLADLETARRTIQSPQSEREFLLNRNWRRERLGSVRSLNQLAVSIGLRLWEDLVCERVTESIWVHLDFDPNGRIGIDDRRQVPGLALCPICALGGSGEEGLPGVAHLKFPDRTG
jgi:hypothetical protein